MAQSAHIFCTDWTLIYQTTFIPYNVRMLETLLRTKLSIPPLRSNLVSRPHLIERLNQGLLLGHKLALVSAPAGFGKTTLACAWAAETAKPISWISLDQEDNNTAQFLAYLIAALQKVDGSLGQMAQAVLQSQQQLLVKPILVTLVNEIAQLSDSTSRGSGKDFVLVLDDYHVIDEPPVHNVIEFLLENRPPELHLVILTRTDAPLPLARLRARNQMVEIRRSNLEFTSNETNVFLNDMMNLVLGPEDIALLETRMEGWIAGLQLAAISLQGQANRHGYFRVFSGDDRYIIDYLLDEVLLRQLIDVLLGALATCGTFVCETAAIEQQIPLHGVAGDFDPHVVCGEPVDPSIQALRVRLNLTGPSPEQGQLLADAFRHRCPVYGMLAKAASIELDVAVAQPETTLKEKGIKMKKLRCRDIDLDCDHGILAESEDEILMQAAEHAQTVHGLKEITPQVAEAVKGAIQEK
jgi:predicted small metal-binding protein/uncharacterized OsmC-like protein